MDENRQLETVRSEKALEERAREWVGSLQERFLRFTPQQRLAFAGVAAVVLATLIGLVWYGTRPDWRTLYAGLDPQDAREMAVQLTAAGIPFDVSTDGATLRVPADHLDKARLQTTAKGGPKSGRMGFELFDKPNWVGSEFDEKVNYQRALEGELEHTINTMDAVQSSRVHLVLPHDSLFSEQQRAAKASVVLKLKRRSLNNDEVDSIRNLVASAVDDLRPDNVVLVDADGHLPLGPRTADAQNEAHEQALTQKLIDTIEPVAGAGNVRASVNVEYDHTSADEVDETYDPNSSATLSMQRTEQNVGPQATVSGVPGTASNAPNTQPPLYPQQSTSPQSMRQESGTYGVSKKVRHTIDGGGKVRRITAAVLINDRMVSAAVRNHPAVWQARNPDEIRHIAELAQAAIGFDLQRGDQVSVQNITFQDNQVAPPGAMERIWQTAGGAQPLLKYGSLLLAFLALLIFVIRPAARSLKRPEIPASLPAPAAEAALEEGGEEMALPPLDPATEKQKQRAQLIYEQVASHLKSEPAQASRLLQGWIHAE
ncbi:MAG TPA: flagellar basal-body MS-ring/collar protein FliF [Acidisarcina sp.]|nr:flagellar basal-body MS-ring/collar protein FliF [Acidisarcina sp.]